MLHSTYSLVFLFLSSLQYARGKQASDSQGVAPIGNDLRGKLAKSVVLITWLR